MDEGLSAPELCVEPAKPNQILLGIKRAICLSLAFFGVCIIYTLGTRLYGELRGLSAEWASARDREPIGYLGISGDQPEQKPDACVRESNGRLYLWAGTGVKGQAHWFDATETGLPLKQFGYAFGRDRIKTIDYPIIQSVDGEIPRRIYPERPVFGFVCNGVVRAYPLTILEKVEVINETIGDLAIAVTYCPLLQQVAVYERSLSGEPVSFGTSGYCYKDAFVLYDRSTDSLWYPQERGLTAITGPLAGKVMRQFSQQLEQTTWGEWSRRHPDTDVLVGADRSQGIPLAPQGEVAARPL